MRRALIAAMVALTCAASGCGEPSCRLDATVPAFVHEVGCAADLDALGTQRADAVFARTETVLVLIDREDAADDGGVLYFIDSERFSLHYEFAQAFLQRPDATPVGTLTDFNLLNYRRENRRFVLGKVVHYLDQGIFAFELAAGDTASADLIVASYERVARDAPADLGLVYRPVSNDQETLLPQLRERIPTIATDEVFRGQTYQALNPGIGYGTLRFRRTAAISGQPLAPTDFAVLDRVPNDVSMVAGIITAEFQTPLAHVGVLAKTRGTPNMGLRGAWDDARLRAFEDQLVRIEVGPQDFTIEAASASDAQAYWDSLRPSALQVPAHDSATRAMVDVTLARVNQIVRIGAKAANLGEMYAVRLLDARSLRLPDAPIALPFAHYADHLASSGAQPLIDAVLAEVAVGSLAGQALERRLFEIRWAIYAAPMDAEALTSLVGIANGRWSGATKLRFRSSTNVEDLAEFTGAGLYTSASARLDDGDVAVANAVKTVWASVWNAQAFVERDFYRVDHTQVRMGVLIHPAAEDEAANGVALTINEFSQVRPAFYINSQILDVSVTNPTGDAVPEQVLYYTWYEEPEYEVITRSSLLGWVPDWPVAGAVLSPTEMQELGDFLTAINARIRQLYPGSAADVEWKLTPDRQIYIKQARPFRLR